MLYIRLCSTFDCTCLCVPSAPLVRRSFSISNNPRTVATLVIIGLLALSLLPARFSGWMNWFSSVTDFVTAPVQWPLNVVVGMFKRTGDAGRSRDPVIAGLELERDRFKDAYFRTVSELDRAQSQMAAMSRGLKLNAVLPFKVLPATVVGSVFDGTAQVLRVRAGSRNGVTEGSVAVVSGVDLLGRIPVGGVSSAISKVVPITDPAAGQLSVLIFPAESANLLADSTPAAGDFDIASAIVAQVGPTTTGPNRGGPLEGPVEAPKLRLGAALARPAIGMVVRLRDQRWPASAQMLVVGIISRVDTLPNGREQIQVQPRFVLPVAEVVVRISSDDESAESGPASPSKTPGFNTTLPPNAGPSAGQASPAPVAPNRGRP